LYAAFLNAEREAAAKYSGKVLQVTGTIQDILPVNDSVASVLLKSGMGVVKCGLDKRYAKQAQELEINQHIQLKCVCSGVSKLEDLGVTIMDVELTRCVIVQ
jgi:hypothetical protein